MDYDVARSVLLFPTAVLFGKMRCGVYAVHRAIIRFRVTDNFPVLYFKVCNK